VTISNSCAYPPSETHYNVVLSIAPGELKTMAVNFLSTRKPGEPEVYHTRDFDLRHLKGPVPAKDWFGAYFLYNDNPMDVALYETKDKIITEGQHRPRVIVPGLRLDEQLPHVTNCVPFNTKVLQNNKVSVQPFVVWDPPKTVEGTLVADLPTAAISTYQPKATPGDSPIYNGPTQTIPSDSYITPLPINIEGVELIPNFRVSDSGSRDGSARPEGRPEVSNPSNNNQLGVGILAAQAGSTATIQVGGPAVEVGSRTLSLNINGVLMDGEHPLTTYPPSLVSQGRQTKDLPQQSNSNIPLQNLTDPSEIKPTFGSGATSSRKKSQALPSREPRGFFTILMVFIISICIF
jgi:hypothetical protein